MAKREEDSSPAPLKRGALWSGLLLVGFALASYGVQSFVERRVAEEAAGYVFDLEQLPEWWPDDYDGSLEKIREIPKSVSLRSPFWYRRVRQELEACPWIERIGRLERHEGRVTFEAHFVRPVLALKVGQQFALLDERGRVLGIEFDRLSRAWGIPFFESLEEIPELRAGEPALIAERRELFALTRTLWEAGVFAQWPHALVEISCRFLEDRTRWWILEHEDGVRLVWGRSPGSEHATAVALPEKLDNLTVALTFIRDGLPVRQISLCQDSTPVVVQ